MNTVDKIKTAKTVPGALLVLAEALDRIEASLDERARYSLAATPVEIELDWGAHRGDAVPKKHRRPPYAGSGEPTEEETFAEDVALQRNEATIAALQARLTEAHTPEDRSALEAQLRLAKDTAANILPPVDKGEQPKIQSDGTNGTVDFTAVGPERKEARKTWALDNKLHEFLPHFTEFDAADAFAKGGPMWLYLGNRDACLAMPYGWRQWLVAEVSLDSAVEAQNMGRDLLKSASSVDQGTAIEFLDQVSGH